MAAVKTSEELLARVTEAFAPVAGVRAVVLGGSRARGTHDAGSDYDIGLYYCGDLDIAALNAAASSLNDSDGARSYLSGEADCRPPTQSASPLMTAIGGWGSWVNG